jgi:hypothetical protein
VRRRVAASLVAVCLAALTGCVALPEAGPVVEVEESGGSATDTGGAAAIDARPPQEGMSAAEVVKGFLDAMQAWPTELSTAKQFLSSETRSTWSPAGTIVYEDALPPGSRCGSAAPAGSTRAAPGRATSPPRTASWGSGS